MVDLCGNQPFCSNDQNVRKAGDQPKYFVKILLDVQS